MATDKREAFRKWHVKLRKECIEAYGHTCECCGETTYEFLTIDHIDGGGRRERDQHGGGSNLLRALRKNSFPPGYRVLCYNCNNSYGMYGYCPHKTIKTGKQDKP
jgi:hypothetical protein